MNDLPFTLPDLQPGSVWMVGAGPGDPGLLSLLAVHALRNADAIVHDALIDMRILQLAQHATEIVDLGKRGGRPSPTQPEINERLIELARRDLRIVRLKGGDPFVFGRGAEEALALVEAGVPFRIVPGVSAGVGGLAYAGIPVTSRDTNSAVCFLTGHDFQGKAPAHDWQALARVPVLVLYMALRKLDEVTTRLMAAGRSASEPVAVVSNAATERQQVLVSTLGVVAEAAAAIEPPALLVVGEVVRLRQQLDWLR